MAHLPILNTDPRHLADSILVVGDPRRVELVAERIDDVEQVSQNREYHSIRGSYKGETISVVSHGVGSAGAGACFEELCQSGAKRIVRCGSAGGMQRGVGAGDVVIVNAAVREEGLSRKLVPESYPAVATPDIVIAMRNAAKASDTKVREGIVLTSDMFYPHDVLGSDLPLWQKAGVTAVEMECATLFVICSLHGVETGAIVAVDGNPLEQDDGSMETYNPNQGAVKAAVGNAIDIALEALVS